MHSLWEQQFLTQCREGERVKRGTQGRKKEILSQPLTWSEQQVVIKFQGELEVMDYIVPVSSLHTYMHVYRNSHIHQCLRDVHWLLYGLIFICSNGQWTVPCSVGTQCTEGDQSTFYREKVQSEKENKIPKWKPRSWEATKKFRFEHKCEKQRSLNQTSLCLVTYMSRVTMFFTVLLCFLTCLWRNHIKVYLCVCGHGLKIGHHFPKM